MPDALQKLTGIYGDVTETDCGLTAEDQETLIQNVAIVFNCAATVKFSEDLRYDSIIL